MDSINTYLERDGSRTIDLEMMGGVYRDHLLAGIDRDGNIDIEVDNYHPDPEESWDAEEWEEHKCFLTGKATRHNWKILFGIARVLVRHGRVTINQPGREPIEAACDGSILTIG